MGKSEILMLLAGVALSVMLAMIAIPMFQSGSEMADKQQVQHDLMAIKSSIPLVASFETNVTAANIEKHMKGFKETTTTGNLINSSANKATYTITEVTDNEGSPAVDVKKVQIVVASHADSKADLSTLTRLSEICDGSVAVAGKLTDPAPTKGTLTCKIKI